MKWGDDLFFACVLVCNGLLKPCAVWPRVIRCRHNSFWWHMKINQMPSGSTKSSYFPPLQCRKETVEQSVCISQQGHVVCHNVPWQTLTEWCSAFVFQGTEIKINVSNYLIEISDILNRVPRQLLLILKTNDVLRGIESALHVRANATFFLNMSRCCVRAVAEEKRQECQGIVCMVRTNLAERWQLMKISVYEFLLWLTSSSVFKWFGSPLQGKDGLYSW